MTRAAPTDAPENNPPWKEALDSVTRQRRMSSSFAEYIQPYTCKDKGNAGFRTFGLSGFALLALLLRQTSGDTLLRRVPGCRTRLDTQRRSFGAYDIVQGASHEKTSLCACLKLIPLIPMLLSLLPVSDARAPCSAAQADLVIVKGNSCE